MRNLWGAATFRRFWIFGWWESVAQGASKSPKAAKSRRTPRMFVVFLFFAAAGAGFSQEKAKKLNVVVICADDLAAYAVGAYGGKLARTPNIDTLAKRGMLFERAYCNAPVCTPSRQAFLTGKYPRTVGVTQLRTPLPEAEDTLAEMLARGGYITAAIGKMHFNSNLKHGFDVRYDQPEYRKDLAKRGAKKLAADIETQPPWKPFKDPAKVWLNAKALPVANHQEDMPGAFYVKEAEKFLQANKEKPFFLMVSFHEPHSPFHFPVEYRKRLDPAKFAVPKAGKGDDWQIPEIFRDLSDEEKQGIAAAYHTSVEYLDHNVGLVLDLIDKMGLTETTLIIFIGDHGYCLGHHGRFEKHSMWEEAVRAPMILRCPRVPAGRRAKGFVQLFDIVPTILEACEQPVPKTVQAESLVPIMMGRKDSVRHQLFVEYSENEEALVRTDQWAFMYCSGKRKREDGYQTGKPLPGRVVRLYDMKKDPEQMTNVAEKEDKIVRQMTQKLLDHLRATDREGRNFAGRDIHEVIDLYLRPNDVK